MCPPTVHLVKYFHCIPNLGRVLGTGQMPHSFYWISSVSHNYIHGRVSNTMKSIRTVVFTVGTSQISKENFIMRTVIELLGFKFIPHGYLKNETSLSHHIQGYWRSVEDPSRGRFYLLGHPCFGIFLSQQTGTAEYTWNSFLDFRRFCGRQFFDRQGWRKALGWFKWIIFLVHFISIIITPIPLHISRR